MTYRLFILLTLTVLAASACSLVRPSPVPSIEEIVKATLSAATLEAKSLPAGQETSSPADAEAGGGLTEPADQVGVATSAPANLRVIYIKDENIWLWAEGAEPAPLTQSGQAYGLRLSPDGLVAAYLRRVNDFQIELWAVNTDGSDERPLVTAEDLNPAPDDVSATPDPNVLGVNPLEYAWIPGGHTLAYNTHLVYQGPGLAARDDLHTVEANTIEKVSLLEPGQGGHFVFSPDGRQIAISTPSAVHLLNADGGGRRENILVYEPVVTYSEYQYYVRPVWAEDSGSLRLAVPPPDPLADPRQPTSLWHIPVDGSPAVQVGSVAAAPMFGSELVFSPDLARILYLRETGEPAQNLFELHLANSDGTEDSVYHTAPLLQIEGWGADSNHFTFLFGENREMQLGQVGAGFSPLGDDPSGIASVRWVDENRFLYIRQAGEGFELRLEGLDGEAISIDTISGSPPAYDFSNF